MAFDVYLSLPILSYPGTAEDLETAIDSWELVDGDGNTVAIIGSRIETVDGTGVDTVAVV